MSGITGIVTKPIKGKDVQLSGSISFMNECVQFNGHLVCVCVCVCVAAGAQKEGAAGFFKGVGKGLVGALTRPTGGIIDMASSTFQGIKRSLNTSVLHCLGKSLC